MVLEMAYGSQARSCLGKAVVPVIPFGCNLDNLVQPRCDKVTDWS